MSEDTLTEVPVFRAFPKIARLNREIIVTEKIDGTNAAVGVTDGMEVYAQSRNRIITPNADNHGFARWCARHRVDLAWQLGPGLHFGEWYGRGIQRGYGITDPSVGDDGKLFGLFDVTRWEGAEFTVPGLTVVPRLLTGDSLDRPAVLKALQWLVESGSRATGAKGYPEPEGVVVYHPHSRSSFKVTVKDDLRGKSHGA